MSEFAQHRAADRMARLPLDKTHVLVLFLLFISWICEAIDLGGTSYIMPSLMAYWEIDAAIGGYYASLAYAGMFVGAILAGALADKLGRKKVVVGCMVVWGVAGVGMALAPTLPVLFACRTVLGVGLGAQLPVVMSWVIEILPEKNRGAGLAFFQAMLPIGMFIACLVTLAFLESYGWRVVIFAEAAPAVFCILIGLLCPESAIWAEARGKKDLSDKLCTWWEDKARANGDGTLAEIVDHPVVEAGKTTYADLFKRKGNIAIIIGGFLMMFCSMGGNYGINTWITSMIALKGFATTNAVMAAGIGILGQILATPVSAFLANRFGRKPAAVISAIVVCVFALAYGAANSFEMLIVTGILFNFGVGLAVQNVAIIQPEIWSNDQRGAGTGLVSSFGRLGAICGPIIFSMFIGLGQYSAFIVGCAFFIISALGILIFLPETKNRSL